MLNTEWLCPAWDQVQDKICGNRAQYLVENTSYCEVHAYDSMYVPLESKRMGVPPRHPVFQKKLKGWIKSGLTSTQAWNLYQDEEIWKITGKEKSMSRGRFNNIFYQDKKILIEDVAEWRVRDREEVEAIRGSLNARTKRYRQSSQKKKE